MNKSISIVSALLLCMQLQAKVYLATDKTVYIAGEQVQCSVFTTDRDALAYVQLFGEGTMSASTKVSLQNGRGGGSLNLPVTLPTGNYTLVTYTSTGSSDSFVIPIFNTFSSQKLGNVKVVEKIPESALQEKESASNGLDVRYKGYRIIVRNTSGKKVSACLSVALHDDLCLPREHNVSSYESEALEVNSIPVDSDGEVLDAVLAGKDADKIAGLESVTAVFSFPGQKSDVYTCQIPRSGKISVPTENVFGKRDVACMLYGMPEGAECHLELMPKIFPDADSFDPPCLMLSSSMAGCLLDRARSLRNEVSEADSLRRTLPLRRAHFMLENECTRYILDDYTRFPTMEEEFVEIVKNVRRRRGEDRTRQIQLAISPDPLSASVKWGSALVMIDGVPVFNHNQIWEYDPALVKEIETYRHTYSVGYRLYDGVVNLVTFKGNLPIIAFDDNVRLYDFEGCSFPVEFRGGNTLYWHPLLDLEAGESIEIDCSLARYGAIYDVASEGVTSEGRAVYFHGKCKF